MIDLSHLTEEEQEMIMTVLKRDAELKKAEEERIRRLEKILSSGSQSDAKLKYLTGEWFYEAKSHRHTDTIHGSEIILASMKQGKAASLDGSLRVDRPKISSSRSSDIVAPPKPARCFEALQPVETNEAEKENRDTSVRSPRMPRHNPFNRASLIVVDPPEYNHDPSPGRPQDSVETEPISPLKSPPAREPSQTSGGSVTSEGSSVGFRPVPKKRTFLSRRNCSQPESCSPGPDAQVGSAGVVPAPRRGLQQGSSSSQRSREEMPPKSAVPASDLISQPAQPSRPAEESSLQPLRDASRVSSNSSMERERHTSSISSDRPADYTKSNTPTKTNTQQKREDSLTQREHPALNLIGLPTSNIQDKENSSHVETAMTQEELSLPQSIVAPDPPMSYDLHYIDKSNQPLQKSNQAHVFKLSTQATSPTGDEEDSIAKVLDWFSRSVDSSEWLDSAEGPEATKSSDRHAEVSESKGEDFFTHRTDGKKERPEMKASHSKRQTDEDQELRGTGRKSSKGLIEARTEGDRKLSQDVEDSADESQPPKISHLKSFWEKSNAGPKILISKSVTPGDNGQKSAQLSAEKQPVIPFVPAIHSERKTPDKYTSNHSDDREQQLLISSATRDGAHLNTHQQGDKLLIDSTQRRNNDLTYNSDYSTLRSSPENLGRSSEMETMFATRRSPGGRTAKSPESVSVSVTRPNPPPEDVLVTRESFQQEELPKTVPVPQSDSSTQSRGSLDSEKLSLSRSSPYVDYKQSVSDAQITTKAHTCRDSSGDRKRRDSEDKSVSPKASEETPTKSRTNSPHSNRQESTAERIKQLKSFWEQERNKPVFYTGKPKPLGEGRVARGANQAKLSKRFTKSEYDLRSLGNDSCSDEENGGKNFTILPLNQRLDKVPPSLSTSRSQFNTLREFWDEASSDAKAPFSHDKPKSPKRKEPVGAQLPCVELKGGDAEIYRVSSPVEKSRPAGLKSSPSPQNRSKSPHDRQPGSGLRAVNEGKNNLPSCVSAESGQQRSSRRSSKDSSREEKCVRPQSSPRKEARSPKHRKDSFSGLSSRGNSLRRATSMFALSGPDEAEQSQLRIQVSPVHSQSRKQRQSADKGATPRRSSEEPLSPARARAFVPTDYRHYLGMTDGTSIHSSLAPAAKDDGSEGKPGYDLELGGPMRASMPVSGEERHSRRDSRAGQRPLWASYSSSDTGQESSLSSTSESWSSSRKNREKDDDLVRKALWRAEMRPKNLAKSMEDITGGLSPRQERRPDPASELRRISDASSIPSPSSSLHSDLDHLKKMSKSVPLFLQNEDAGTDVDSPPENGYHQGKPSMGSSVTNLNGSSGMMSVSPLSGSVMTMYGGDFGNVEVQGNIQFSINYIHKLREFHIFVAECRDLAAVDPKRARSDPYVKSYLVPDRANLGKRKTSVKKKTLNPTFNEILRYRVRMEYLRTQTLILSVWHHDTFGRNSFLGEVDVDLSKWDFDHTQMNYLALKARATPTLAPSNGRGEMRLSIRFLPQIIRSEGKESPNTGEIHIWVKECKNLPLIRASIDPYVKCFVLPDTSRKSRQKTRVLRRTVDPVFNHTMVYDGIREADLTEACVELTVWDRDRLASNLLGGLRLGSGTGRSYGATVDWMDSSPYEVAMWQRMLASPNEWVEGVLPLRMLNSAKTALK